MTTSLAERIHDLQQSVRTNVDAFVNAKDLSDKWMAFLEKNSRILHDILTISDILRMNRTLPFVVDIDNDDQIAMWVENENITIERSDAEFNRIDGFVIEINNQIAEVVFYTPETVNGVKEDKDRFYFTFYDWAGLYRSSHFENYLAGWNNCTVSEKTEIAKSADTTFNKFEQAFEPLVEKFMEYVEGQLGAINQD